MAIRIVPTNQAYWLDRDAQLPEEQRLFRERDVRQNAYMTLGAGPDSFGCSGILVSAPNRPNDLSVGPRNLELLQYPPAMEDALIHSLIMLDSHYGDDLLYWCFPDGNSGYYNSNGYAHGLLNAAELPEPAFVYRHWIRYRGWFTPLPSAAFEPSH